MAAFKLHVFGAGDRLCRVIAEYDGKSVTSDPQEFSSKEFDELLAPLQDELIRSGSIRRAQPNRNDVDLEGDPDFDVQNFRNEMLRPTARPDLKIARDVGTRLFEFLFDKKVEPFFRDAYDKSLASCNPLPIRLYVEEPDLSDIPWETLYDSEIHSFVSSTRQTPLIRSIPGRDLKFLRPKKLPLRILGMIARPVGLGTRSLDPIDAEGEQLELKSAFKKLEDEGRARFHWTLSGSQPALEAQLIFEKTPSEPWDIFHFIGHGGFDDELREGFLVIQEEDGLGPELLPSHTLKGLLIGPKCPQLVVLNSCEGACSAPGDLFSSVAVDLISGGIPAVVAMQYAVTDNMAKAFSGLFYKYLAHGETIETAITLTRINLQKKYPGWIAPVLYLRLEDFRLYDPLD